MNVCSGVAAIQCAAVCVCEVVDQIRSDGRNATPDQYCSANYSIEILLLIPHRGCGTRVVVTAVGGGCVCGDE